MGEHPTRTVTVMFVDVVQLTACGTGIPDWLLVGLSDPTGLC